MERPKRTAGWQVWGVLVVGFCTSLSLSFRWREEVFCSGDGGLKLLFIKQLARGDFGTALHLAASPEVARLWSEGYYPFEPPFVYPLHGGHVVSFPMLFLALTAPFFRAFGLGGVYVIPALAAWIWAYRFHCTIRVLGVSETPAMLLLIAATFCTPVIVYGSMFWEHSLGMALAFASIEYVCTFERVPRSATVTLLYGLVAGLSVWLRPEAIVVLGVLSAVVLFVPESRRVVHRGWFVVGVSVSVVAFLFCNQLLYGRPLGLHGEQAFAGLSMWRRFKKALYHAGFLSFRELVCDPTIIIVVAILSSWAREKKRPIPPSVRLSALLVVTVSLIACFVPNNGGEQWAARYLLVAMPIGFVALALLVAQPPAIARAHPGVVTVVLGAAAAFGFVQNGVRGQEYAQSRYDCGASATRFLREHPAEPVLVSSAYTPQILESAMVGHPMFLCHDVAGYRSALGELGEDGFASALAIRYMPGQRDNVVRDEDATELGQFGCFDVRERSLRPTPRTPP